MIFFAHPDPESLRKSKYFLILVGDFSRLMWVSPLKKKSEAYYAFKKFKVLAYTEKNLITGCLRTYQGGEFISK